MKSKIIIGEVFGRWKVVGVSATKKDSGYSKCVCACGNKKEVANRSLLIGRSTSCGCATKALISKAVSVHGLAGTPEYNSWQAMRQRTRNKNCKSYPDYGGRGIKVCKRWDKFQNFIDDMGNRPSTKHTLERKNNDGNYDPNNCFWATKKQQSENRRPQFSRRQVEPMIELLKSYRGKCWCNGWTPRCDHCKDTFRILKSLKI